MEFWRRKKQKEKQKKMAIKYFFCNGCLFLRKLIADCNGMSNPIRMFTSDQISMATNHFDPKYSLPELAFDLWFDFYMGVIDGRPYVMKRYTDEGFYSYDDIVLSARVSNHSGFLKLIGSCLEFTYPVLVFEDLEYRALNKRGTLGSEDAPVLPWYVRWKIAKEVATAITYLHTAFPRIILHRYIQPDNVFLDKNWRARLTDFSGAVTLPEGESWTEDILKGTIGYGDPIYMATGIVSEYSDVFSFGIFMLVLLLGRPAYMDRSIYVDRSIHKYVKDLQERGEPVEFAGDSNDIRPGQMKMFLELALRCCEERNEDRPKMISVAKEIILIERSVDW